jgi:hypothetical protein
MVKGIKQTKFKLHIEWLLFVGVILLTIAGVYSNVREQQSIDESKLPSKVEDERSFQRWITNLKNKNIDVEADDFELLEKNEIYNTKWIKVASIEEEGKKEEFDKTIAEHIDLKHVVFSPSEREFIDYRNEVKTALSPNGSPYQANEVRFYGQKEAKILDARILDCSVRANCYFDRAYFLSNDLFVITEFSRNIDKKDTTTPVCPINQICTYTIKLHLVDLINNARYIYESDTLELNLQEVIPEL